MGPSAEGRESIYVHGGVCFEPLYFSGRVHILHDRTMAVVHGRVNR